jgi:hypothetical protein
MKVLGDTEEKMADYLDTVVAEDKIELVKQGVKQIMIKCTIIGVITGIPLGIFIFLVIKKFVL